MGSGAKPQPKIDFDTFKDQRNDFVGIVLTSESLTCFWHFAVVAFLELEGALFSLINTLTGGHPLSYFKFQLGSCPTNLEVAFAISMSVERKSIHNLSNLSLRINLMLHN